MKENGKVWFVGAGPGDPELLTLKAQRLLKEAGAVLYAGSLVSQGALVWCQEDCTTQDSKGMDLDEINQWLLEQAQAHPTVVRLQTGDPSLYGALVEMADPLLEAGVQVGMVPGVSSAFASAAAAGESLTLPEITQTVILSRVAGRTPMPQGESLPELAAHHCTLCLFLSITLIKKVVTELLAAGWEPSTTIVVVQKASWPGEEKVIRAPLDQIEQKCKDEGIKSQAMIIASPTVDGRKSPDLKKSKLYDPTFSHQFRHSK